jgi:hypothetical protein
MISRRKLLKTAAATGAASLLLHPAEMKLEALECAVRHQGVPEGYISMTAPSDPDFSALLDTHFPGLAQDTNFQKIRPYAVLIKNVSGKDINAFSTYWSVESPTGGYELTLRHFFHPSQKRLRTIHFGTQGNQTRFTGQIPAIKAGATRLLTPYFNWSTNYYRRNPKLDWAKVLASGAHASFTLDELSTATAVHVSPDAVIFDQSQVAGPDRASLAKTYTVMRNAEHDTAAAVANLIPCEADPASHVVGNLDQIRSYLATAGQKYPTSKQDAFKDRLYRKVRQRQATILARRLKHATPDQFVRTVQYLASQPKTTIQQVPLA